MKLRYFNSGKNWYVWDEDECLRPPSGRGRNRTQTVGVHPIQHEAKKDLIEQLKQNKQNNERMITMAIKHFSSQEEMDDGFERTMQINQEHLDLSEKLKDAERALQDAEEELLNFEEENKEHL